MGHVYMIDRRTRYWRRFLSCSCTTNLDPDAVFSISAISCVPPRYRVVHNHSHSPFPSPNSQTPNQLSLLPVKIVPDYTARRLSSTSLAPAANSSLSLPNNSPPSSKSLTTPSNAPSNCCSSFLCATNFSASTAF